MTLPAKSVASVNSLGVAGVNSYEETIRKNISKLLILLDVWFWHINCINKNHQI